jgi:hypothetical protein
MMGLVWELLLPDSEKLVLLALADCANDEGHCWPSMATLARKCSKSDRTIQGCIQSLCARGHLTRREVVGKGCNYTVHPIVLFGENPRSDCAPEEVSPRRDCTPPPKSLRETPEAASDKPSKNHQEPSEINASGDAPTLLPEHVFEFYQQLASALGLPVPRDITPERRQLIRARIAQYSLEDFQTVFAKCRDSPFLRGDRGRTPLTIDWLMKKGNFQKVLEGNYD